MDDDDDPDGTGIGVSVVATELTDELDLHTFRPAECADVVEEYVRAAHEVGMTSVRIIHGKGRGALRRTTHAVLARHPAVRAFRLADERSGSWGATLVEIRAGPKAPRA